MAWILSKLSQKLFEPNPKNIFILYRYIYRTFNFFNTISHTHNPKGKRDYIVAIETKHYLL
jgi:hypothetical protein